MQKENTIRKRSAESVYEGVRSPLEVRALRRSQRVTVQPADREANLRALCRLWMAAAEAKNEKISHLETQIRTLKAQIKTLKAKALYPADAVPSTSSR